MNEAAISSLSPWVVPFWNTVAWKLQGFGPSKMVTAINRWLSYSCFILYQNCVDFHCRIPVLFRSISSILDSIWTAISVEARKVSLYAGFHSKSWSRIRQNQGKQHLVSSKRFCFIHGKSVLTQKQSRWVQLRAIH